MKICKLFLFFFSTLLSLNSNSQIFVGGNIRLNASNSSTIETKFLHHNLVISPNFGKYLSEKLALGVALNYSNRLNKQTGSQDDTFSTIGLSPFLRYDFFKMGKFAIYGQGAIGLDFRKEKPYTTTVETKSIRTYLSFNPGLSYNLNDDILLMTSLYFLSFEYEYVKSINDSPKQRSSTFNFNSSLDYILSFQTLYIGAIYKF